MQKINSAETINSGEQHKPGGFLRRAAVVVIVLVTVSLAGGVVYLQLSDSLKDAFRQRAEGIVDTLVTIGGQNIESYDWPMLEILHQSTLKKDMVKGLWIEDFLADAIVGAESPLAKPELRLYQGDIFVSAESGADPDAEMIGRVNLVVDETSLLTDLTRLRYFLIITQGAIVLVIVFLLVMLQRSRLQARILAYEMAEREKAEHELHKTFLALDQSPVSVAIMDINGVIEYVNPGLLTMTGLAEEDVLGQLISVFEESEGEGYSKLWEEVVKGRKGKSEFKNHRKNGDSYWEMVSLSPIKDSKGNTTNYLNIREDITVRKEQEEYIRRQATYDSLTDLPNRSLILKRLRQMLAETERTGKKVAIMFLDLDDFKKINDTLGHDVGDKILIQTSQRLQAQVRSSDIVGRLGGDEFVVLLGDIEDTDDVSPIAEKLNKSIRDSFFIEGRELTLSVSIGIAIYPDDGADTSELLRSADVAMYHSKEKGRNIYHYFSDAMNQGLSRRLLIEEQLRGALDRDELSVCYQPKTDLLSGRPVGVEALLRWHNHTLGHVSPAEFIPVAEHSGLIVNIGRYVLQQALQNTSRWIEQYDENFTVAVNFSPLQFRDPDLVSVVKTTLTEFSLAASALEMEITEGVLMSDHAEVVTAFQQLNDLGIVMAMDDFGTGYSSLSYLRSYPFNVIKIDRSFVTHITENPSDRELVNAIIGMAHGLGMKVVAEGIETEEQRQYLAQQGCDIGQGYFFSKPVTPEEITEMLKANNACSFPES